MWSGEQLGMVTPGHHPHRHLLDTESDEANFSTKKEIVVGALICLLVCFIGWSSLVRWAQRRGRWFPFQTPASCLPPTGLKKRELHQIPVAVYGPGMDIPETDCPICLGEFVNGEKVRVLPKCNHGFHIMCIDAWLVSQSSCPICRHSLLEHPTTSSDVAHVDARIRPLRNDSGGQGSVVVVVVEVS